MLHVVFIRTRIKYIRTHGFSKYRGFKANKSKKKPGIRNSGKFVNY